MFARLVTRSLPIRAMAAPRAAVRFNSSTTTTPSSAARVLQMAAEAERPNAAEAAVPVMWAVCGALTYTAWNRQTERSAGENVEKLLVV